MAEQPFVVEGVAQAGREPARQAGCPQAAGRVFSQTLGGHDAVESAIRNHELAYRMQSLVPDVLNLSRETAHTQRLYGIDSKIDSQRLHGLQCCEPGG